jgi:ribosomal protein L37E
VTTDNQPFQMAMCRRCGHDLYVIRNGKNAGQVRCTNRSCRFARSNYAMGKTTNEGPVAA